MRCLIITPNDFSLGVSGIERFINILVSNLQGKGFTFKIVHRGSTAFRHHWYDRGGIGDLRLALNVRKCACTVMSRSKFDLVLANGFAGWGLRSRIPVISVFHGTIRGLLKRTPSEGNIVYKIKQRASLVRNYWTLGSLEQLGAKSATLNVAVSNWTKDELVQLYGVRRERIVVIENGVDVKHFRRLDQFAARSAFHLPEEKFIVLYTGRNDLRKGADTLISVAESLHSVSPDTLLVAATDRPFASRNVLSLINVPYDRLPLLYSAADVFLLPSRSEGCSFSLIEAMASQLPVVATAVGHARDIAARSQALAPFIIPPDSQPSDFVQLVLLLKSDKAKRHFLGCEVRDYVLQHNSAKTMADAYSDLFARLVTGKRDGYNGRRK